MKRARDHDTTTISAPSTTNATLIEPTHPFAADYNDSFETPETAIRDILPALTFIAADLRKPLSQLRVWDPFFCTGAVKSHFTRCGVPLLIHNHEDFYKVISENRVPKYDVFVTNPPYSSDHKEKTLAFAAASGKPYLLLLPAYVATKAWFVSSTLTAPPFFASPPRSSTYAFTHPEGTGKTAPPFTSLWVIGGMPAQRASILIGSWRQTCPSLLIVRDVAALAEGALITSSRRKNPKQRRAEKARFASGGGGGGGGSAIAKSSLPISSTKKRRF